MIPSFFELESIFLNDADCIRFLEENGVFYERLKCPGCGNDMDKQLNWVRFRCPAKRCRKELTIKKHTFFEGSMLRTNQIMLLAYFWLSGVTSKCSQTMTGFSSATVATFYGHFRQLVATALEPEDCIIGGPGIVVEVDETKIGKRKYNRGHRVEGVWVVVGVERTPERRVFMVPVNRRDASTLTNVITQHVAEGSVVHTDLWRGYAALEEHTGLRHLSVNHSVEFVDSLTGVHTNTVEGTNFAIKRQIPIRCRVRSGIEDHLAEFAWRRRNNDMLWEAFIHALRDVHYDI